MEPEKEHYAKRIWEDLSYLESLCIDAGFCTNCVIAEVVDLPHEDCAGPEGYCCDCYCDGEEKLG